MPPLSPCGVEARRLAYSSQPSLTLYISDVKTRASREIPSHRDAFGSRLQILLYHRLLVQLMAGIFPDLSSSPPLDFEEFWRLIDINPRQVFTDAFAMHLGTMRSPPGAREPTSFQSVNDLYQSWRLVFASYLVVEVADAMALEYHFQGSSGSVHSGSLH